MIDIAISSWSLHGQLGQVWYEPDQDNIMVNHGSQNPANLDLLDLPAQMAENGIFVLELCNFHLPSVENSYLHQLKQAMQDAGVSLANLLIDTGNLSAPDDADRLDSLKMASFWQDVAGTNKTCRRRGTRSSAPCRSLRLMPIPRPRATFALAASPSRSTTSSRTNT